MKLRQEHCLLIFVFLIVLPCVCSFGLGPCPKRSYIQNFDVSKFLGQWNEIERSFYFMELISSCVSVDLSRNAREQIEISVNTKSRWSGKFSISDGIVIQSRKDPSVFLYRVNTKLPRVMNRYLPGAGLYQVLQTDYTRYAILYSCTSYQLLHTDLVWIWGRKSEISADLRADIYRMLEKENIDSERLILPKNQNCTDMISDDDDDPMFYGHEFPS